MADSGPLKAEIDDVARRLDELQSRFDRLAGAESGFGRLATSLSSAVGPARTLSGALDGVISRIGAISRTPVVIDIRPAVASLTRLLGLIEAVRARLRALPGVGPVPGLPGVPTVPGGGGVRGFASGGLVTGPAGVDRVPALLTAGEFVLRRPAAEQLGLTFLNALNSSGGASSRPREVTREASVASSSVTTIGDVNVTVRQAADVAALLREMRLDGGRVRKRAG